MDGRPAISRHRAGQYNTTILRTTKGSIDRSTNNMRRGITSVSINSNMHHHRELFSIIIIAVSSQQKNVIHYKKNKEND